MSIVVIARLFPNPGQTAELLAALEAAAPAIHAEPGCELYAGHEAPDGTIVMIEKWSTQADLDGHLAGEPVKVYRDARAPYEAQRPQLEVLVPRSYGDAERGAL